MAKRRKRAFQSGTVYEYGGRWFAELQVDGRRLRRSAKTKAEAMVLRQELVQLVEQDKLPSTATLGALIDRWLDHLGRSGRAPNTLAAYSLALSTFEGLRNIPAAKVTPAALQRCLDEKSGRSRQVAFDKIRQLYAQAIRWEMLSASPVEKLDRPTHKRNPIDAFSRGEIRQIATACAEERYGGAILLAITVGLRSGELWGIRWGDLSEGRLTISRQAAEQGGQVVVRALKTEKSARTIALPRVCLDAIERRRTEAEAEGNGASDWVFPAMNGKPTGRSNFGHRVWQPFLKRLGLRHRGFHHCRHSAASLLLNEGCPVTVVAAILGHATPQTTLETYSHLIDADDSRARKAIDEFLLPNTPPQNPPQANSDG